MEENLTYGSHNGSSVWNTSEETTAIPREFLFNADSLVSVVTYTVLFSMAAVGNLTVFVILFKHRHRKSRVNLFIMHLCIADLIVTFIMLPMEIGWHVTVSWLAGDLGCRVLMFLRTFGFYLSSFILIAISLDRYFAVKHPLSLTDASRRGKIMLVLAWACSAVASAPQSVIFHQESNPTFTWFSQCVTFNFFPDYTHELAYNLFNLIMLYLLPLLVISVSYTLILIHISRKTRESLAQTKARTVTFKNTVTFDGMRRSCVGKIEKARSRTLKMTLVIVCVFIMCWTPYFVMSAMWWFDKETAKKVDYKLQRGLFIFAVSNSCMNPFVYGMFTTIFQREFRKCFTRLFRLVRRCTCTSEPNLPHQNISPRRPSPHPKHMSL